MERRKIFTFGKEFGPPFKLEIRGNTDGRRLLSLTRDGEVVAGPSKQALELLEYLLQRPGKDCLRDQILWAISPHSGNNLVDKYISALRDGFSHDKADKEKFIETVEDGYRFRLEVNEEGDLASMEGFAEWNRLRFHELMGELKRGPDSDAEDLRIITTGISPSLEILDIKGLLRRQLRIRVLFMNPGNEELTEARYGLRKDKTPGRCIRELNEQIADVEAFAKLHRRNDGAPHRAWLEYLLSDAMPCGFVIHTRRWALVGLFLAHTSYSDGPMFEIHSETEAWEQLHIDWKTRWHVAEKNAGRKP